jgi:hypothetical protein
MLAPQLREVHVIESAKNFTIAISLTILDGVMAMYYGGVVWRAWSKIPPAEILLIFFAGLWAITLAHFWVHAVFNLRRAFRFRDSGFSRGMA